jgi:Domain of unknown function (DUF4168)
MLQTMGQWCRRIWLGLVGLIVAFCWAMPSAIAQPAPAISSEIVTTQTLLNRPNLDPNNIPSEKVNQFVHACLQVVKLIERREGELQATETEAESLQVEQEIEAEAIALIEQAGLTRQEYLQLLGLANTDPEFGERVAIQLQETQV